MAKHLKRAIVLLCIAIALFAVSGPVPFAGSQTADTTFQVRLVLNNTGANFYIPGVGETSFSDLPENTYQNPPHFFLASEEGGMLASLVHSYRFPLSMATEKDASTYGFRMSQNLTGSRVFLVFSEGGWRKTDNRMDMIERGEFLENPYPSFSYGMGNEHVLKVMLAFSKIDIEPGDKVLQSGYYKMIVENEGRSGGKDSVSFSRI